MGKGRPWAAAVANRHWCAGLTGKDGAELGPAGDPPFRRVLAQRHFQEEHRESAAKQEDEVRDQKRACGREKAKQLRVVFGRLWISL